MEIILENGYNTDYIYSVLISLFYVSNIGTTELMNNNMNDSNATYIQEYIKTKIIYQIQNHKSIESKIINKLRLFLYNCGWLKNENKLIVEKESVDKFYKFLISKTFGYNIKIIKIMNNKENNYSYDMIHLTEKHIEDTNDRIVNVSSLLSKWIDIEMQDCMGYKFDKLPFLIPIYVDIDDKYINVFEGIKFNNNGDAIQQSLIWDFHSLICKSENGDYYSIIRDKNGNLINMSDNNIPSDHIIDDTNILSVKKIMREIKIIFYKLS